MNPGLIVFVKLVPVLETLAGDSFAWQLLSHFSSVNVLGSRLTTSLCFGLGGVLRWPYSGEWTFSDRLY